MSVGYLEGKCVMCVMCVMRHAKPIAEPRLVTHVALHRKLLPFR
jgi:hypothetical protein